VLRYRPSERALYIESVSSGGAAERGGLQPRDRVMTIDGSPVDAMSEDEVRARLRGEVGSHVRLHVDRDGTELDLVVERAPYRSGSR
jgi:carboxyl-terminal processing protease